MDSGDSGKAARLCAYYQEMICSGRAAPGGRLPPLRRMAADFNVSLGAAKAAVDRLAEMGLVESRRGSGCYVRKGRAAAGRGSFKVAVLLPKRDASPGILTTVFLGMRKAAEDASVALFLNFVSPESAIASDMEEAVKGCDGLALLGEYDAAAKGARLGVPAVGVCMADSLGGRISIVDIDPLQAAETATEHFAGRGAKEVLLVGGLSHPAYRLRGRLFRERWKELGGKVKAVSDYAGFVVPKGSFCLFTTSSAMQACSENTMNISGKTAAEAGTVLSIDGKSLVDPGFHKCPTIAIDWEDAGACALEECLRRIRTPGASPRRIYMPGRLVE